MARTFELDEHWAGMYYCNRCEFYTGSLENHIMHGLTYLPKCEHETEWSGAAVQREIDGDTKLFRFV